MTSLRVVEEPTGWAVRVGHGLAALYPSRLHALEQARLFAAQFVGLGEEAEVIVGASKEPPAIH